MAANARAETARQFGSNLRCCRRRSGVSQEALGFLASLDRTEIGLLERGERTPRIDTLVKLARSLDVPPEELLVLESSGRWAALSQWPAASRSARRTASEKAIQEKIGRGIERGQQAHQRGQANLADPALDARHLHGGEAGLMGQLFLRPALCLPRCPDVGAEALDRSIHEPDRLWG